MATAKMTQKDYFNQIIDLAKENGRDDIVEFAKGRIEILNNKKSSKSNAEKLKKNNELKDKIASVLSDIESGTVTDILANGDFDSKISNQKISAMLRQMIADGIVERGKENKSAIFSLIEGE